MPRNKRTDSAPKLDASELPELTAKQLRFVRGILEGKTASDAYRAAYDAENMSDEAIWVAASVLRHDPKVTIWLHAARSANMDRTILTLEGHLSELARLKELAIASGNMGAAVLAETNRGKASALYTDRVEDVTKRQEDVKSLLSRIAQMDPVAGAALAAAFGLRSSEEDQPTEH